ncbi:MAG: four-carbon acid sugar kinase family protein [Oscillospiraceae bacterium]|jgi:uncharacterized protein YgbK (DUF1537 family)|nr:four-carbon acid sugar kinase family protein [Oscillospiraceae bacterium]
MVYVIADDLTGGNATGVMMVKKGFETFTVIPGADRPLSDLSRYDCIIYPTDSRGKAAEDAYDAVLSAARQIDINAVGLYSKRIDSTLRGNLGSETDALLDHLGGAYTALAVPAFPAAGRTMTEGHLSVNGIPLHRTSAARDPKNPVTASRPDRLMALQSKYPCASVYLDDIKKGPERLGRQIGKLAEQGARIIIFDAVNDDHIETIARAAFLSGRPFAAVDPGPFTAALAARIKPHKPKLHAVKRSPDTSPLKSLAVIGSVNSVAAAQVDKLNCSGRAYTAYIDTAPLMEGGVSRDGEIARVCADILKNGAGSAINCVVSCGVDPDRRVPFEPYMQRLGVTAEELSLSINAAIGSIAKKLLGSGAYGRIFTSGGDITVAVCRSLGANGLRLVDEIVPLAAYATLAGGAFDGLAIITKGGMVGDENTLMVCLDYNRTS